MPTYDLLVRNATLVTPDALLAGDLAVVEGRVAAVGPGLAGRGRREIDSSGLHLFPGLIDAHVHFNEPGRAEWEGFASGSAALAAGGGTLFVDMPLNSSPPTVDSRAFEAKRQAAERSSRVDFALWGGLVPGNTGHLEALAGLGAVGFKAFLCDSGLPEFPPVDEATLFEGMTVAARLGLPVAVHAESETLTRELAGRIRREGRRGARDWLESRPLGAELAAVEQALAFAAATGARLHVVHASAGSVVARIAEARARGVDVTCETCPHYLTFTEEDLEGIGAAAKCAPPLRPAREREALWQALLEGEVDLIASDHSPAPPELKHGSDFFAVWGGIAGAETTLRVLLTEGYAARGLSLPAIARLTAQAPAKRFGLAPRKGSLEPGADADFSLVDLRIVQAVEPESLHFRHRITPYAGLRLRGRVQLTAVRGRVVFEEGRVVAEGGGRFVRPGPAARARLSEPGGQAARDPIAGHGATWDAAARDRARQGLEKGGGEAGRPAVVTGVPPHQR